jgi:integrase
MWRQREREVIPVVTNRDLRRTWKTLAGQAGISKEIRDRIQNHTLQDVSSKSYDRWNYMPEKRAAMKKWNSFVKAMLTRKRSKSRGQVHVHNVQAAVDDSTRQAA